MSINQCYPWPFSFFLGPFSSMDGLSVLYICIFQLHEKRDIILNHIVNCYLQTVWPCGVSTTRIKEGVKR